MLSVPLPRNLHNGMLQKLERDNPALAGFVFAIAVASHIRGNAEAKARISWRLIVMIVAVPDDKFCGGCHLRRALQQIAKIFNQGLVFLHGETWVVAEEQVHIAGKLA